MGGNDPRIYVGTSAWAKAQWRGGFYPKGLASANELSYLSRRLTSLEVNATFHGLRKPSDFARWRDATPEGFVFAVKAFGLATASPHLAHAGRYIHDFFASGVGELGEKLGPVLWQFPATLEFDAGEVERFIALLPKDARHAIEARNASFAHPDFAAIARTHDVAIVATNSPGHPQLREVTADYAYVRLSSGIGHFEDGYDNSALDEWAATIRSWGRDAYVYFSNPQGVLAHTPYSALRLVERVGRPFTMLDEPTLF